MPISPQKPLTYKSSGVDIAAGDSMVDQIRHLCQRTHSSRVMGKYGAQRWRNQQGNLRFLTALRLRTRIGK